MLLEAARGRQRPAVISAFEDTRSQAPTMRSSPTFSAVCTRVNVVARHSPIERRYTDALRIAAGAFAQDPTLVRDVVRAYAEVAHRARPMPKR